MAVRGAKAGEGRRPVIGVVLALIALALIVGGVMLLMRGGSFYYLAAGLLVAISSYLLISGDRRGIWVYGAMLALTVIWALFETGLNPWGLQARILAPAVLGIWVAWPYVRRLGMWPLSALALVVVLGLAIFIASGNRISAAGTTRPVPAGGRGDWPHYGNDLKGSRFSPLTQINANNVDKLEVAWTYRTGAKPPEQGFEATPLMVNKGLYLCTSHNIVIALDPETGKQRWRYDPKVDAPPSGVCRGVSYYEVANAQGLCAKRIIFGTTDARLMAVDANTGQLCPGFGNQGTVDLKKGMGEVAKGYYYVSSAPTIVNGNVVLGGWVLDQQYVGEPSGVVRAFDAVTGKFAWAWDMDRPGFHGEPPEGQTYSRGTANSWGPMSGDEALGLVYLPTGNSTPDYWGAHRSPGSEKYSTSVVALDSRTGEVRWSFQTLHHDLWDHDVAAQPTLIDLPINGQIIPALIQGTKQGQVYLLDRRNGKPLAKVQEKPVPQGAAPGDFVSPTQPFSVGMPAFDNTLITEQNMWGITPLDQLWCRIKFREARYEGPSTPPGLKPSIFYPSYLGGIGWGGVSVDPERRRLVVNWNRVANYARLVTRAEADKMGVKISKEGGIHVGEPAPQMGTPFAIFTGAFLSPLEVPCTQPPFGKIGVVDLDTRKVVWDKPLGTSADSGMFGIRSYLPLPMGVPNSGGSLTTRAGLVFIGATQERAIRAFDINTGKRLWWAKLPAGGHASPMSYISPVSGRQFIVISAGGNAPLLSGRGDYVVAFALPQRR